MNRRILPHRLCRLFAAALSLADAGLRLQRAATDGDAASGLLFARRRARRSAGRSRRAAATAPTLIINPPHAAAGFDSPRIIYVRETHKLEYFAHSEWVDTPARMLAPLIVAAVENSGAFRAVVLTPSAAAGDLRLDTEIIRLQHEFLSAAEPGALHAARLPRRRQDAPRDCLARVRRCRSRRERGPLRRSGGGQPCGTDRTRKPFRFLRRGGAQRADGEMNGVVSI